jgi:GTP-binding protein
MKSCVAIIGRPNVGKSTFFNRLIRKKKAIVADSPGVTRDRIFADAEWNGKKFLLVDTGGMIFDQEANLQADISRQSMMAVDEADIIIFLMDGKDGVMPEDENLALYLRKTRKKIFWVVNKLESARHQDTSLDFYRLGMDRFYAVSAAHGLGISELMDDIVAELASTDDAQEDGRDSQALKIAVVGKPNVGKSSLLNRLLGEKRLVTSNQPGTTVDAIEVPLTVNGHHYLFFDTAGLRKKARVREQVEGYGNIATIRSIDYAQIVLLMIDATAGITDQDIRIAALATEKYKTIIFVFNKIDLPAAKDFTSKKMMTLLGERLPFIYQPNALRLSVVENQGIGKIFPLLQKLDRQLHMKVTTGKLNRMLKEITDHYQHPLIYHHPLKFYYITQISGIPPAFVVFCNMTKGIKPSYIRYLKKKMMEYLDLSGIPLRLYFRKR